MPTCATAAPGAWARLDLEEANGVVVVELADVDLPGQRRGQTSPYVLVVTDDTAEPDDQPDDCARLDPLDVTVRWALAPSPCPAGLEEWHCARPTLLLGGAVARTVPIKKLLLGQSGCWPDGTGVTCAGASGASYVSLKTTPAGVVQVRASSVSDGACEPATRGGCEFVEVWTRFTLRPGVRLIADPAGTFPPLE